MRYEDVAELLPGVADGSITPDERTQAFIGSDLRCQADLARYRRLLRHLRLLRDRGLEPAPGLLVETLSALEDEPERRPDRGIVAGRAKQVAIAGAIGGAAVAATAVIFARSRRRLAG